MAASGCNFCDRVGIQPISNDRATFNYACLEVRNKTETPSAKGNQVFSDINALGDKNFHKT
jgi:hypothetical protein